MPTLREKLVQAGLITPDKSHTPRKGERRKVEKAASGPIPKLPPLPGSKAHQREEARRQSELDGKLRAMVVAAEIKLEPGSHAFYFSTRKGKLRRLEISEAQAGQLERGELAVVERVEPAQIEHALVPPLVAEQMLELSERSVRFFNRADRPVGFLSEEELSRRQAEEGVDG